MANEKTQEWTIPVSFYFRVDFQQGSEHIKASFTEVSGLEMQLNVEERTDDSSTRTKIPQTLSYANITLKRPLTPLSEAFTKWMNDCFGYMESKDRKIKTYDMVIKLLDGKGKPLAGWLGRHAYPIKWSLNTLDASKSEISNETVTLTCTNLKRITNIR